MKPSRGIGALCTVVVSFYTLSSHAALITRLGGLAFYDDVLGVTWTADADINGWMNWTDANAWVDSLTIGGKGGWRLPSVDVDGNGAVVDCSTASALDCRDNEMGYMYFQNGVNTSNPTPFSNLSDAFYWSGTVYSSDPFRAWIFLFSPPSFEVADGQLGDTLAVWAVHDGDIAAVPLPGASVMFLSGLLGLIGIFSRKKATTCT
jgi:hypothetical protein